MVKFCSVVPLVFGLLLGCKTTGPDRKFAESKPVSGKTIPNPLASLGLTAVNKKGETKRIDFQSGKSLVASGERVFRFFDPKRAVHFYTANEVEKDYVVKNLKHYNFEGEAYKAVNKDFLNAVPVYRFYNTQTNVHLYTISDVEKEYIEKNLPHFKYENIAYHAFAEEGKGSTPIYRFYENSRGVHFFTANKAEADYVKDNLSNYSYEGVAFYAFPKAVDSKPPTPVSKILIENYGGSARVTVPVSSDTQVYVYFLAPTKQCDQQTSELVRYPMVATTDPTVHKISLSRLPSSGTYWFCALSFDEVENMSFFSTILEYNPIAPGSFHYVAPDMTSEVEFFLKAGEVMKTFPSSNLDFSNGMFEGAYALLEKANALNPLYASLQTYIKYAGSFVQPLRAESGLDDTLTLFPSKLVPLIEFLQNGQTELHVLAAKFDDLTIPCATEGVRLRRITNELKEDFYNISIDMSSVDIPDEKICLDNGSVFRRISNALRAGNKALASEEFLGFFKNRNRVLGQYQKALDEMVEKVSDHSYQRMISR